MVRYELMSHHQQSVFVAPALSENMWPVIDTWDRYTVKQIEIDGIRNLFDKVQQNGVSRLTWVLRHSVHRHSSDITLDEWM